MRRLLGDADWQVAGDQVTARMSREQAADVQARLRGLAFAGLPLSVRVRPQLKRPAVRAARTRDARARRDTTPGFTKSGTKVDDEGRWSLTPDVIALAMGKRAKGRKVLDLTCGAGGNTIGFARAGCSVTAVELDRSRLQLARHNARVYGVLDRVHFVHGDAKDALDKADDDTLIFFDPPWNEPDKLRCTRQQIPLLDRLYDALEQRTHCWLKLPPSFDPQTASHFDPEPWFGRCAGDMHRVKFLLLRRLTR